MLKKATNSSEYILTFSSFYKAMYAKEKLQGSGIDVTLRKTPPELIRSCGQGLYIDGTDLQKAIAILSDHYADAKSVFQIIFVKGRKEYRRIN